MPRYANRKAVGGSFFGIVPEADGSARNLISKLYHTGDNLDLLLERQGEGK